MHQHRVLAVPQQVRCYEARTDIGEADVEALHPRKLRQSVDVRILKPLGGGVGGATPSPLVPAMELITAICPPPVF